VPTAFLYPVCLGAGLLSCEIAQIIAIKVCHVNGAPCCPVPCGETACCFGGDACLDPTRGVCCDAGTNACHGRQCCQPTDTCLPNGTCCPQDRGICNNICCPPGQACSTENTCCTQFTPGLPPVSCRGICCAGGEVCKDGVTCCAPDDPVCKGVCCEHGACDDEGNCCSAPNFLAGGTCCSPFDHPCGNTCCAPDSQCINNSCCADDQICGGICCPAGQSCQDPASRRCGACPPGLETCLSQNATGVQKTPVCCAPGVNCCNDVCCLPGKQCCTPLFGSPREFGCHDPDTCLA
jgi:hypothetical protein